MKLDLQFQGGRMDPHFGLRWPLGILRGWTRWLFLAIALCGVLASPLAAAPYPPEGLITEWTQPDGTVLTLRVFGDEFYARTVTKDGYTVVFNEADRAYHFATVSADGSSLVSSGVQAHCLPPAALVKGLLEPGGKVAAVREANIRKYAPDRAARWAARVDSVQRVQARAAGLAPEASAAEVQADVEAAAAISGARVGLMILVQFPDDPATGANDPVNFPTTQAKILRYANEVGYTDDGNTGSIRDYFYDQSNGLLTFTQSVTAVITLGHPRAYYNYADYPTNGTLRDSGATGRLLVADAIAKLKTDGFNFTTLSADSNNSVYATSLLFAGADSGQWAKGLWPHAWSVASRISVGTSGTPRYIDRYQCTNVANSAPAIGTNCHELGHLMMSYPDLYDTDTSDGDSEGVGQHCLMGSANHLNGGKTPGPINLYLKEYSGWANITDVLTTQSFDATLASTGNRGFRIYKPGSTTEYFLFENRGTGDRWAASSPDKGIAIWHIDTAVTTDNKRQQMTSSQHYEVSLEQADGIFDLERNVDRGDANDLFDNSTTAFNNSSNPNADWWNGTASGISFSVLSPPGANMDVRFGAGSSSTTLTVTPASQSVTAGGGSFTFAVTSNANWSWTKDAVWVTTSEAASQSGNQDFSYSVSANTSAMPRSATITLTAGSVIRTYVITQDGASVDDHGNTTATATVVAQSSTTNGNIEVAGDIDVFRINVSTAGTLTLQTTGTTDTYGRLLNSAGTQLTLDDDTGVDQNFLINWTVTPGTYYISISHYDSVHTGSYQLVCSHSVSSTLVASPTSQSVVAGGGSHSFDVTSSGTWSWSVNQSWVTSSEGTTQTGNQTFSYSVAANTTASSRSAVITLTSGSLTATHTINQAAGAGDDHGNSTGAATLIAENSTTNGNLETGGDVDYFRINVSTAGSLTLFTTGGTDTYGTFMNAAGTTLVFDDDAGDSTNFQLTYAVSAGTYYVAVSHYSPAGTGTYQLASSLVTNPTLSLNPSSATAPAAGGSSNFTVNSNTSWTWSSDVLWITSSEAQPQTGTQGFTYTVAANSGAERTGTITFTAGAVTAIYTVTQAGNTTGNYNLKLYKPGSWSDTVVLSTVRNTSTDAAIFRTTDVIYLDYGPWSAGLDAVPANWHTIIYVDGVQVIDEFFNYAIAANTYISNATDKVIGSLSEGTHTVRVVLDALNEIPETNETDNEFTKTITVLAGVAPTISMSPSSVTIANGQNTTLSVVASGSGLTYQWYRGLSGSTTNPVGSNSPNFTTPLLATTTSYWVRVSNAAGAVDSDTARVTVMAAPVIVTPPVGVTIVSGQSATLNVVASGTGLTYEWFQGVSTPVGTNAASFTTPALTATTSYWVRVSNAAGAANSGMVQVTVVADLDITVLGNGVAITGLSGALQSERFFRITVPAGAKDLFVELDPGSGRASFTGRRGALPTGTNYDFSNFSDGTYQFTGGIPAGDYFFRVLGTSNYSGFSLKVSYTPPSGGLYTISARVVPSGAAILSAPFFKGDEYSEVLGSGSSTYLTLPSFSAGYVFQGWYENGELVSPSYYYNFTVTEDRDLEARFAVSDFDVHEAAVEYQGLIRASTVDATRVGFVKVKITEAGSYTGSFKIRSRVYPIRGTVDWNGGASIGLIKVSGTQESYTLRVERSGELKVTGAIFADQSATFEALPVGYVPRLGDIAPEAGTYTVLLPASGTGGPLPPTGFGYGRVLVSQSGAIRLTGKLSDGLVFSQSAKISRNGRWPVYATLYANQGYVCGWVEFRDLTGESDLDGTLEWLRPPNFRDKFYVDGFRAEIALEGSAYTAPPRGLPAIDALGQEMYFNLSGDLGSPLAENVFFNGEKLEVSGANEGRVRLQINRTIGIVTGLFRPLDKPVTLQGVILQKSGKAGGFYKGLNEYGAFEIGIVEP